MAGSAAVSASVPDGARVGWQRRDPGAAGQHGAALLIVIGATSALAVIASLLLVSSLAAYRANSYRADRDQAYLLADAALDQTARALRDATLPLPSRREALAIRNGRVVPGGLAVPVAVFPVPSGDWPATTDGPVAVGGTTMGVGATVRLEVVMGPRGDLRGASSDAGSGRLIDAHAAAWFRRAHVTVRARFVVAVDGFVRRLD